jgi:A/G-specific adenine glycosylase
MVRAFSFAEKLIAWQRRHGRRGLPWQGTRDPYRIWLSEVMLQQTQVAAVIPYYERFLRSFPTLERLAGAGESEVLRLWSGLGYYARGRNLYWASRKIVSEQGGRFPNVVEEIEKLPGIGRSTAAAIAIFAFGRRAAILDGNVKRVLARCFGIEGFPGERAVETRLWKLAESLAPRKNVGAYTQGLMDLGATVCAKRQPRCGDCPVRRGCVARRQRRTNELPAPRPKKRIALKQAAWVVLMKSGEVLLERRPSSGLWGGLWTFPETDEKDLAAYCRRTLGYAIGATRKLEPLEHGFTHFRLRIQPVVCEVRKRGLRAEAPGRLWLDLAAARSAAIPAPVRTLLARLSGGN